jgi:glucose-1-phosphate thymidylyltransferase
MAYFLRGIRHMNKAILLAGGFGTRLQPATKFYNKHLLPIYSDRAVPMIYYPISTLVKSGITDILIISSREHCGAIIENLSDGQDFGASFTYKIQDLKHVSLGIASALKLAEGFVGDDSFAVILGDNVFEDTFTDVFEDFDRDYKTLASVFLKEVSDPHRFGVASIENGIVTIEEKPKQPKSNLAVTGLYLYTPHVFKVAQDLQLSDRGELEVSHINDHYCQNNKMKLNYVKGFWSDAGTPESLRKTQDFVTQSGFTI